MLLPHLTDIQQKRSNAPITSVIAGNSLRGERESCSSISICISIIHNNQFSRNISNEGNVYVVPEAFVANLMHISLL
jgi:hypothetical protein